MDKSESTEAERRKRPAARRPAPAEDATPGSAGTGATEAEPEEPAVTRAAPPAVASQPDAPAARAPSSRPPPPPAKRVTARRGAAGAAGAGGPSGTAAPAPDARAQPEARPSKVPAATFAAAEPPMRARAQATDAARGTQVPRVQTPIESVSGVVYGRPSAPPPRTAAVARAVPDKPAPAAPRTALAHAEVSDQEERERAAEISNAAARARAALRSGASPGDLPARDLKGLLVDVGRAHLDTHARSRAAATLSQIAPDLDSAGPLAGRDELSPTSLLRKWGRISLRNRSEEVDDFGLDPAYEASLRPFFEKIYRGYFRAEIEGLENIPARGRALLVCNHSGALPWDGIMLRTALRLHHATARELRWLVEDHVFHAPFLGSFVNRIGAVRACQENAERLLSREDLVAVFPEGIKGIAKPFSERYKLQRFGRGGYVRLALRTGAPVIPVAIVGAEETYPLLGKVNAFSRSVGLPFIPITPTFPWLGPLGFAPLPSRWRISVGAPIREIGRHEAEAAKDEVLVQELNECARSAVRNLLDEALKQRGQNAFV